MPETMHDDAEHQPGPHEMPHPPQLFGSVVVSTPAQPAISQFWPE
jgi:hypothetical protein